MLKEETIPGYVFSSSFNVAKQHEGYPENITSFYVTVILSGAFPREDLIFLGFSFFINILKDGILTSHNSLLRMTEWVDEILTSHRTFLTMAEQEKIQIPLTPFAKGGNDSWACIFILI